MPLTLRLTTTIMKTILCIAATLVVVLNPGSRASAQTSVLESPVVLTSTVLTQGTDTVKKTLFGVTITTKNIKSTPFTNREVLAEMLKRSLITGTSTTGWSLVYLLDDAGNGGIYARKTAVTPVAVPADLLTLPVFGPSIKGGTSVTTTFGVSASGSSEIAFAAATVNGIPVSGLATNGKHTITLKNSGKTIDAVTTAMTFDGGVDGTPSARLAKGVLAVGSAKVSTLTALP